MNPVYIRMIVYFLAPVAALLPGVGFDQDAATVTIDLEAAALGLSAAAATVAGVFAKWGKK